jgi:GNAT superfamily N-acetyltransferase
MANADIEIVGQDELELITALYNDIFRPPKDADFFRRRFRGRLGVVMLVAHLDRKPVGFATGFELKPSTFFAWLCGVLPAARRCAVASQLMEALHQWARDQGYRNVRFECYSRHRPMLHLAIKAGYDIVGIRWDPDGHDNLIIFEMSLLEGEHDGDHDSM